MVTVEVVSVLMVMVLVINVLLVTVQLVTVLIVSNKWVQVLPVQCKMESSVIALWLSHQLDTKCILVNITNFHFCTIYLGEFV